LSRKSSFDDDTGFTLIEALVALAIVATVLAPVGAMIATTVKGTRSIDQRLALAGTAETLLTALPARNRLAAGRQSGEMAGHRWQTDVSLLPSSAPATALDSSLKPRWLALTIAMRVQAPGGRTMLLNTIRLIPSVKQ
jgi:general secretion pathway protein I